MNLRLLPIAVYAVCLLPPGTVCAQSFRIDNKVYVGDGREVVHQSTTIFHEQRVYDYLEKPAEAIVFDRSTEQFTLLDMMRHSMARVAARDVLAFTEQLRQRNTEQADPLLRFLLAPAFHEQFDAQTGTLNLQGTWMTYRAETMAAPNAEVVKLYRDFSDWSARLSPMLVATARPPFARLMLNSALEEHRLLPREVTLTITTKRGVVSKRFVTRSEHQLIERLSESDLNRVKQTHEFMVIYNPVSLEQYRK